MSKPLFRWTLGDCLQQGLDILAESIRRTTQSLGIDRFDWMICHNGLRPEAYEFVKRAIGDRPILMFLQRWEDCPIVDNTQTPRRKDGSFEWNGARCGGTMWKVCPPRLRPDAHEIIMDNDVILLRGLPEIDRFLECENKALILEEPIRFYGRIDPYFEPGEPYLNSGLMGMPPYYDFGKAITEQWEITGCLSNISQADEQGLLMLTLSQLPSIRIGKKTVVEVLNRDFKTKLNGMEAGIHFTQANRIPNHFQWAKYLEIQERNLAV